jgi:uncharacterized protein
MVNQGVTRGAIRVSLAWSPSARQVFVHSINVAPGATLLDALHSVEAEDLIKAGRDNTFVGNHDWAFAIWGKKVRPDVLLHEGDRIEITRGLKVDPKIARRERFRKQGSRSAGLFKLAASPKNETKSQRRSRAKGLPKV